MSTPVTLERYAEMRAEMDTGRLRDEVLARAGLTTDQWTDTQRAWLEKMGTELERGQFELTNRYTQAFLERQRALSATASPLLNATKAVPPPAPTLPQAVLPEGKRTADDASQTLDPPLVAREALPFTRARERSNEPADVVAGTTQPIDIRRLIAQNPLPFKVALGDAPAALHGEQEAPARYLDDQPPSTVPAPIVRDGPALPFVNATEAPREAARSPSPRDPSAPRPGGALPFHPGSAPSPSPEQARLQQEPSSLPPAEAMKRAQGISLGEYAAICAAVEALPDQVVQIRRQYGLDVHAWTALHSLWQERFQRDPTIELRWQALVQAALLRRAQRS